MNSRLLFRLTAAVYLISWFSPVHEEVSTGFEAYWRTAGGFLRLFGEPIEPSAILMAISPHTNYVVLLAFFRLRRLRVSLLCCAACNAVWLTEGSQLRFGYYLWLLSFVLFALAAHWAVREDTTTASAK
jgi:hypothetical protein